MILFSVIIPAHNVENFIESSVNSILSQDFPKEKYEIIVIDDCSTDNTYETLKNAYGNHKNITIIRHQKNKRQGGSRNTGVKIAKGDWIFFLDADDLWLEKNVFTTFSNIIKRSELTDIIRSVSYQSFKCNHPLDERCFARNNFSHLNEKIRLLNGKDYVSSTDFFYNIWTGCYRSDFLIKNELYFRENVVFEDSDWPTNTYYQADNISLIDYPFYGYRINPNSTTNKYTLNLLIDDIKSNLEIEKVILMNNMDEIAKKACRQRIKTSILTIVKRTRHYKSNDSIMALTTINDTAIINPKNYDLKPYERIVFWLLNNNIPLLVHSIKLITRTKRIVLKIIKR